jgi:excisionase family DNA binding protein
MKADDCVVRKLIADGLLPAAKIGKRYVLLESDVMAFIEAQVVKQTAERMGLPLRGRGQLKFVQAVRRGAA